MVDVHIDGCDTCVCCGRDIPEGSQYCILCGFKVEHKKTNLNSTIRTDIGKVEISVIKN